MTTTAHTVAIVGPTSSGKTDWAIRVAQACNGEVISADSRQVYRGLDIGSGKVTPEETQGIPHHLLDVADVRTVYTASDFKQDATRVHEDIRKRGRTPIIAGGTFFYVEVLRGTMHPAPVPPDPALRASLEPYSDEDLFTQLRERDPKRAETIDPHNRRRLLRALEIVASMGAVPEPEATPPPADWCTIGIDVPPDVLSNRIYTRLTERLEHGMIDEVRSLVEGGVPYQRLDDLGLEYRYVAKHLQGELTYDELVATLHTRIKQFAKRQRTWLRRDTSITWFTREQFDPILAHVRRALGLGE